MKVMNYSKRRTGYRKSYRRGRGGYNNRQNAVMTTNGLRGGGLGFKSRKTSRRAWKKQLWNGTLHSDHYRSTLTTRLTIGTPLLRINAIWQTFRMYPSNFYSTAGGAYPPITGTSDFTRSVTIRGGKCTLRGFNASADACLVRVFMLRTILGGTLPPTQTNVTNWDPTMDAGFRKDFKIYKQWSFAVDSNESFSIEHRLGVSEYDTIIGPNQYVWNWGLQLSNLKNDASVLFDFYIGHNISYSGDLSVE